MTSNGIPPTRDIDGSCTNRRAAFLQKVQRCAAKLVAEEDCWRKHDIPSIPAERIIRHEYDPIRQKWSSEETIGKIAFSLPYSVSAPSVTSIYEHE